MKLIDNDTLKSVSELVEYLYEDERNDYEEMYTPLSDTPTVKELEALDKAHIFNDVVKVNEYLKSNEGSINPHVKITPFDSPRSNKPVANQWVITTDDGEFFQSYQSIIAFTPYGGGKTVLDEYYWNYSTTTSKYRNEFLGETTAETKKKIESGVYILGNLNQK